MVHGSMYVCSGDADACVFDMYRRGTWREGIARLPKEWRTVGTAEEGSKS